MATHTIIDEGLDYWQHVAETLNKLANAQPDKKLPHNSNNLYKCIHDYDRTHWVKAVGVVKRLYRQAPHLFEKGHVHIMNEIDFLIFQKYSNLTFNQNPLDNFYRSKTNNQKYQGVYLSKWGFKGLTMFREVWNNCESGNNSGRGPNKNHRPPTQSPSTQFNKLFNINKPKGEKE